MIEELIYLDFKRQFLPRDAMLAWYMLWHCVCLSVYFCACHKFVTSQCFAKTAEHSIMQTKVYDSLGNRVTTRESITTTDLSEIPPGSPPAGAPNAGGVNENRRLLINNSLYFKSDTR